MVEAEEADEDATLMATFVATRDRKMFERLFLRHRRAMVAYAGRYVKDRARAEELAQEIFVRVYTARTYEPTARFKTWLYRVATNICLNELRRPEHKQRLERLDDPGALLAPSSASPEAAVAGKELAIGLERALRNLPEKQRAAFLMARHEDLSHEEIAEALATSIPSVKSLIHRALEALRRDVLHFTGDHAIQRTKEATP